MGKAAMSAKGAWQVSKARSEEQTAERTGVILAAGLCGLFFLYIPVLLASEFFISQPCETRSPSHECSTWSWGWGSAASGAVLLIGLIAALAYGVTATERRGRSIRRWRITVRAVAILTSGLLAGAAFTALQLL